jgi:hypothetical protein
MESRSARLTSHTHSNSPKTHNHTMNSINTTSADQELCKDLRDADLEALYQEVSGSINEIRGLLAADDSRWEAFGLNIPADPTPPEVVTGLTVTAAGPGKVLAAWSHARRAAAYRVFQKVMGVDTEFHFVERVQDLEFTLKGLTAGQTVAVQVAAVNEGGEAGMSAAVDALVG